MPQKTSLEKVIAARSGKKEPLLGFKWICDYLPFGHDPTYMQQIDVPFVKFNVKSPLYGGGHFSYYPGNTNIETFNATFYEDSEGSSTKWLLQWMTLIKDFKTGAYFLPPHYKRDIKVTLLDTMNSPVITITMKNAWPTGFGNWDLNYTDSSNIILLASFSVDNQFIDIG